MNMLLDYFDKDNCLTKKKTLESYSILQGKK